MKIKRLIIKNHPELNDIDRILSNGINLLPRECGEIIASLLGYSHLCQLLPSKKSSKLFASLELECGDDIYEISMCEGYICYLKNNNALSRDELSRDTNLSFFDNTNDPYYFFTSSRGEEKKPVRFFKRALFSQYTNGVLCQEVIDDKKIYVSYDQNKGYLFLKSIDGASLTPDVSECDDIELSLWCFLHKAGFNNYYQRSAHGISTKPPLFIFDLLPKLDLDEKRRKRVLNHLLDSENQILLFEEYLPYTSLYCIEQALEKSGLAFVASSSYAKRELDTMGYSYFELDGYLEDGKMGACALAIIDIGTSDFLKNVWELAFSNGESSIFYIEKCLKSAYIYNGEKFNSHPVPSPANLPFTIYLSGEALSCTELTSSPTTKKEGENMEASVIIKDGTLEIEEGEYSFYDDIDYLFIPKSVRYIHHLAFDGISSIKKIEVDKENPVYHSDGNCIIKTDENKIILGSENAVIPDYVEKIGKHAFNGRLALEKIEIPEGVYEIGYMAFALTSLSDIDLPKSVKAVDSFAFALCKFDHSPFDKDKERFEIMGVGIDANLEDVMGILKPNNEGAENDKQDF